MSKYEILYRKRRWLNQLTEHSVAFVWAKLTRDSGENEVTTGGVEKWIEVSGQIKIRDCARYITLEFQDDYNSIQKLQKLIGVLQEFQTELENVYAEGAGPA